MSTAKDLEGIRRQFDANSQKWYFSIVDSVGIVHPTSNPRNYWKVLKNRLKKGHNQLVTECNQLKMPSSDGKSYLTDVGDQETILKLVEIVSKKDAVKFRQYFSILEEEKVKITSPTATEGGEKNSTYPQEYFELPIDGYKLHSNLIVRAFVAGVAIEKISIIATPTTLSITGVREVGDKNSKSDYSYKEIQWGAFSRQVELPVEVDVEKIEATHDNGVLMLKLPIVKKIIRKKFGIDSL